MQFTARCTRAFHRWTTTQAVADTLAHGTWTLISVGLGALTVGTIAVPASPVHHWIVQAIEATHYTVPPGTIASMPQALGGSCTPAVFPSTTGTLTLTFPEPLALNSLRMNECGDPYPETVVISGRTAQGWSPIATATIPWDGSAVAPLPVQAYTALSLNITQSTPDAQIAGVRVRLARFVP